MKTKQTQCSCFTPDQSPADPDRCETCGLQIPDTIEKSAAIVDMTPTWESIVLIHAEAASNGNAGARAELARCARMADKIVTQQKAAQSIRVFGRISVRTVRRMGKLPAGAVMVYPREDPGSANTEWVVSQAGRKHIVGLSYEKEVAVTLAKLWAGHLAVSV